jgi:hypothetical protein
LAPPDQRVGATPPCAIGVPATGDEPIAGPPSYRIGRRFPCRQNVGQLAGVNVRWGFRGCGCLPARQLGSGQHQEADADPEDRMTRSRNTGH